MRVLALDTSSTTLSCALVELGEGGGAQVLAQSRHGPPAKAGDLLPGALLDLCARAALDLADIEGLAAGLGPGSFTGLRLGLAAVKALAFARRLPVAGASSLHALAHGARSTLGKRLPESVLLVPTLAARKGELYAAAVRGARAAAAESVVPVSDFPAWLAALGEPALVFGEAALEHRPQLALPDTVWAPPEAPRTPPAWAVAELCAPQLRGASYDQAACFALAPNYLQPSTAEVALREGRVGGLPRG